MSTHDSANLVTLTGRISGARERALPSGDVLVSFRVIVDRPPKDRGPSGKVRVDAIECSTWRAPLRRRALGLADGTPVELTGRLRRRFWRGGAGLASMIEVEATTLKRIGEGPMPR